MWTVLLLDMPKSGHQVTVLGVTASLYLQCNKDLYHGNMFVSESVISIVRIMSIMASVQVTGVISIVVRDEVCRGVCGVGLVLSVLLLCHS
jgi:hypothetical protein